MTWLAEGEEQERGRLAELMVPNGNRQRAFVSNKFTLRPSSSDSAEESMMMRRIRIVARQEPTKQRD